MPERPDTSADQTRDASSVPDLGSASLLALESDEHLSLLDEIDNLRSYGVNEFVSLPALVVCGDQSAGKSSALEAITEIPFPRSGKGMCTKFATQIMMRRKQEKMATVKILPYRGRSDEERIRLAAFNKTVNSFSELPSLLEEAGRKMGLGEGRALAKDTLSIEVSGPDKPQLTIIDTPGLIHSSNRAQTSEDVRGVSDLVQEYIQDERTIILAVVSARNDVANQAIMQRARSVDPSGARTLGIITKPDSADIDQRGSFMNLAMNEDIFLQLGWHVLRSRTPEELESNTSFEERNKTEEEFFKMVNPWRSLPSSCKGVEALRKRLGEILFNHMRREIPHVHREIVEGLKDCTERLSKLGEDRSTVDKQRQTLLRVAESFSYRYREAVNGSYHDTPFFHGQGPGTRLRANIQERNEGFAEAMRVVGHLHDISQRGASLGVDPKPVIATDSSIFAQAPIPLPIEYSQAIDWVMPYLKHARGRELPGTFPSLLISELFAEHSKPWDNLASTHIRAIWQDCRDFVVQALIDLAPPDVSERLLISYFKDVFEEMEKKAKAELQELLEDRRGHAITYNNYYVTNVQANRAERLASRAWTAIKDCNDRNELDKDRLAELTRSLRSEDTDRFACEEALDCMLAYYKIVLETFIDNVAVIVVERRLVRDLWKTFTPITVHSMSDDHVNRIAAESPDVHEKRKVLEAKRAGLEQGLKVCDRALTNMRIDTASSSRSTRGVPSSEKWDWFGGTGNGTETRSKPALSAQGATKSPGLRGLGGPNLFGISTSNSLKSASNQLSSLVSGTTPPNQPSLPSGANPSPNQPSLLGSTKPASSQPSNLFGNTKASTSQPLFPFDSPKTLSLSDTTKTSSNQQPSLFDTAKTSSNRQPSLFDTAKTSSNRQPSLFDTAKTSSNQQPSPFDTTKTSSNQQPSPFDTTKTSSLFGTTKTPSNQQSSLFDTTKTSSLFGTTKTPSNQQPSLFDTGKTSSNQQPSLFDTGKTSSNQQPSLFDTTKTSSNQQSSPFSGPKTPSNRPSSPFDSVKTASSQQSSPFGATNSSPGLSSPSFGGPKTTPSPPQFLFNVRPPNQPSPQLGSAKPSPSQPPSLSDDTKESKKPASPSRPPSLSDDTKESKKPASPFASTKPPT